jgi:predicted TIM-barrel fold metal-dependent hydrolase
VVSVLGAFGDRDAPMPDIDRSIPFVDAHHHVTEPSRNPYGWLTEDGGTYGELLGDYKVARADWPMDRQLREFHGSNVVKSVHVEAAWSGPDPVDETRYLANVTAAHGIPNAYVVLVDLVAGDAQRELAAHLEASALVRGVRIREHPADGGDARFLANLRVVAGMGLSFETRAWPGPLAAALQSARAVPDLAVVVGSTGMPLERGAEYFAWWRREMAALADLPNTMCKVSGMGMADHRWTVGSIRPWVLECIELFGVERCMFGSNWPVDAVYASYQMTIDAYRTLLVEAGLSRDQQWRLLSANAEACYRI